MNTPDRWRLARWIATAALLLVPLLAMRFTREVAWTAGDFVLAGLLLFGANLAYDLASGRAADRTYRAGLAVAVLAALATVWADAAVGIVGSEDNPLFLLAPAVAVIGSLLARLRPPGMALAMLAAALAQLLASAATAGGPAAYALALPWLLAAELFRRARTSAAPRRGGDFDLES